LPGLVRIDAVPACHGRRDDARAPRNAHCLDSFGGAVGGAAGGPGLSASGGSLIVTRGDIRGGYGVGGLTRAAAIEFSGGGNVLTLENGCHFAGNVLSAGGDTLVLGGDALGDGGAGDASLDLGDIGAAALLRGFDAFEKRGSSRWTLTGVNTAPGWTVREGVLEVTGTAGNATVSGGTLAGSGTLGIIDLGAGGMLSPGGAPGTLHAAALTWNGGGTLALQLGSNAAGSDGLVLSGALARAGSGSYEFQFSDAAAPPQVGSVYTLIAFADATGFSAADFGFHYTGTLGSLQGHFLLQANALVLLRDGFDGADAGPGLLATLAPGGNLSLVVPVRPAASAVDVLLDTRAADGSGFRLERLNLGAGMAVRVVGVTAEGSAMPSAWTPVKAGERLALSLVDAGPQSALLIESGASEQIHVLPCAPDVAFRVELAAAAR
jgi:hypothetical protein